MKARELRLLLAVGVLAVLMLAPLVLLGGKLKGASGDSSYRDLAAVGASLDGDRDADTRAAEVLKTLKPVEGQGREVFAKEGADGTCWVLDMSKSPRPSKGDTSLCA